MARYFQTEFSLEELQTLVLLEWCCWPHLIRWAQILSFVALDIGGCSYLGSPRV